MPLKQLMANAELRNPEKSELLLTDGSLIA